MPAITKNIHFHYQYRDAGNYKTYGSVVFSNPQQLSIEAIRQQLKAVLIDGEYFVPHVCNIPLIYEYTFDPELDHGWYEFDCVEETEQETTDQRSIDVFIQQCQDVHWSAGCWTETQHRLPA